MQELALILILEESELEDFDSICNMPSWRFGPGSSTAISSTAVSSTLGLSKPVLSTN